MPGEAFTEVREHAKRQGTNVSEQRHSSAGQAAHRGHTTANAPGNRRLPRGPRSAPARATTWQQEPPPRLSLPGNKRAVGSSHQARAGKCFRQLPRRPRVPRRGGAAGAAPAPGSLFSGRRAAPATGRRRAAPTPGPQGRAAAGPRLPGPPRGRDPLPAAGGPAAGPHTPPPCRSRTLGLLRLAGPAPTAGPCRRPVCLPPPRTRPPPRFLAARAHPRLGRPRRGPATPPRRPGGGRTNFAVYPSAPRATGMGN